MLATELGTLPIAVPFTAALPQAIRAVDDEIDALRERPAAIVGRTCRLRGNVAAQNVHAIEVERRHRLLRVIDAVDFRAAGDVLVRHRLFLRRTLEAEELVRDVLVDECSLLLPSGAAEILHRASFRVLEENGDFVSIRQERERRAGVREIRNRPLIVDEVG
jgi:hypothetical protein